MVIKTKKSKKGEGDKGRKGPHGVGEKRIGFALHEDPRVLPLWDVLPRVSVSLLFFLFFHYYYFPLFFIRASNVRK